MNNKPINTKAKGDYDKGFSGAPNTGGGSIEGKAKGFGEYDKTFFSPNYITDYQTEPLTGAYAAKNQNKG